MVARGRGKKAAVAAVAAASETIENVTNGDENGGTSEVVAPVAAAKKGRVRGAKKDEAVETQTVEIVQKPTKPLKAPKGSKKTPKGKASEAEQEKIDENDVAKEKTGKDDVPVEEPEQEVVVDKKTSNRKRKNDSAEKGEDAAPVTKKAPRVTKTKAAKKETVDIDGIPENPAAAAAFAVVPEAQTNGNKKSSSRKRAAPKIEEPVAIVEPIAEPEPLEPETEIAPQATKKSSKSKGAKKETKKTSKAPKSKESKKTAKAVEEDAPEDDILPEDEFVPEIEEEEEEKEKEIEAEKEKEQEPKARKPVKSKGSRKQLKEDVVTPVEEVVLENNKKEEAELESEPQESEVDSVKEEPQQKSKGKKAPAAKKASTKKAAAKKSSKSKKGSKEEQEEILKNEEQQDEADVVISKPKTNGTVKPITEPVEKKTGRGRKRATPAKNEEAADEPEASKTKKPALLVNPTVTEYKSSTFGLDKDFKLKISSWNIAGLRSWLKKDGLDYLQHEQPDILCLQETKCTTDQLPEEARIPGYHPYWLCMPGGHAGVAVYSKIMPINVEYGIGNAEHDEAGRMITAEYEKFYLVCVYVPNSGRKLVNLDRRMQWEELFRKYIQELEKVKPVIIAGDMNVAHNEIDLANPKTNTKNAGFTPQEREQMTKLLELGYVDTFRHLYPEQKGAYTFWSYMGGARSKNVGWRLDYFIVSDRITSKVVESSIRPQVLGSDHCPITLFLNI